MSSKDNPRKTVKDIVREYLDRRATDDAQFAVSYAKPKKSIDECWRYILGEARRRGSAVCMSDEEVFGLAVHYYDEDDIKVQPAPRARVSTSGGATAKPRPSDKEKAAAKKKSKPAMVQPAPSLFDDIEF